jgi:hypothetical protein
LKWAPQGWPGWRTGWGEWFVLFKVTLLVFALLH